MSAVKMLSGRSSNDLPGAVLSHESRLASAKDLEQRLAEVRLGFGVKVGSDRFSADYRRADCGAFTLIDIEASSCAGYVPRTDADGDPADGIVGVTVMLQGTQRLISSAGDILLKEGDVVMMDKSQVLGFESDTAVRECSLLLSRSQAFATLSRLDAAMGNVIGVESPQVRLFVSYLRSLADQSGTLSRTGSHAAGQAALELLRAGFSEAITDRPAGRREARRAQCRAFIESRLPYPELTPKAVADHFDMSIRTLYDLFADEEESVAQLIRRRRLERCRDDLMAFPSIPVTEVAFRWGFTDSSNFTRAFRAHFGLSPSALRASAEAPTHREYRC